MQEKEEQILCGIRIFVAYKKLKKKTTEKLLSVFFFIIFVMTHDAHSVSLTKYLLSACRDEEKEREREGIHVI